MVLAFIFSIPFGTKKFLFSFAAPFENFYTHEYAAAFLFGTDLLVFAVLFMFWFVAWRSVINKSDLSYGTDKIGMWCRTNRAGCLLGAFLFLALLSIVFADYPAFAWYSFLRLALAVSAGYALAWAVRARVVAVRHLMSAFALSAVFQSLVAFFQFGFQKSAGLWWLGETTVLGPSTPGVASIAADGMRFLRAYGTLSHANILAGFLILGLLALSYLFLIAEKTRGRALAVAGIVAVETGLLLTFSRSGWIVAALALAAFFVFALTRATYRPRALSLLFSVVFSLTLLIGALQFAVLPRARLVTDEGPVSDRWRMNKLSVALVVERPWGVGIGNELFFAYDHDRFREFELPARGQWQPTHNLFLLIGSEIGIVGLIAFLFFVFILLFENLKLKIENSIVALMLCALLLFGLLDHFLLDLHAGRLMLWAIIGMAMGARNTPQERVIA